MLCARRLSGLSTGSAADATTTPTEGGSSEASPSTDSGDGSTGTDGAPTDAGAHADADTDPWDAFQGTKTTDTTFLVDDVWLEKLP